MSHGPHPDVHDAGLADGCAECAGEAEDPLAALDEPVLGDLIERTLRNRFGGQYARHGVDVESPFGEAASPRSETEARAMAVVMTALERTGRLAKTHPELVALYLRERWAVVLPAERRAVE